MSRTVKTVSEGDFSVALDDRYYPIFIATWVGEPNEQCVDRYFDWYRVRVQQVRADRTRCVMITDVLESATPNASVRRHIAKCSDELPTDVQELALGSYVVLSGGVLRGALTAMEWIVRRSWSNHFVGTVDKALRGSPEMLRNAGVTALPIIAGYKRPRS